MAVTQNLGWALVNHLFITDKVAFGLKEENVSDK